MNVLKWIGVVWCSLALFMCALLSLFFFVSSLTGPSYDAATGITVTALIGGIAFLWFLGMRALLRSVGVWPKPVKSVPV